MIRNAYKVIKSNERTNSNNLSLHLLNRDISAIFCLILLFGVLNKLGTINYIIILYGAVVVGYKNRSFRFNRNNMFALQRRFNFNEVDLFLIKFMKQLIKTSLLIGLFIGLDKINVLSIDYNYSLIFLITGPLCILLVSDLIKAVIFNNSVSIKRSKNATMYINAGKMSILAGIAVFIYMGTTLTFLDIHGAGISISALKIYMISSTITLFVLNVLHAKLVNGGNSQYAIF